MCILSITRWASRESGAMFNWCLIQLRQILDCKRHATVGGSERCRITQIGRLSNARSVAPPETTISQMNETECDFRSRAKKVVAKLRPQFYGSATIP